MSEAIRQRVQAFGLRVRCEKCGAQGRHRPETDGRLSARPCPGRKNEPACGGRLRTLRWFAQYQLRG